MPKICSRQGKKERTMKKVLGMSLLIFVVLGCTFVPARAQQDRWEAQVRRQLRQQAQALNILADGDIEEPYAPFIRSLNQDRYQDVNYRLVRGVTYVFTGACDEDCRDLDLKLFGNGTKLKEDVEPDDTPIIAFRPEWTGTYTLRVIMANCNREPCRFGVGIFR
jgi:hypothetical protein